MGGRRESIGERVAESKSQGGQYRKPCPPHQAIPHRAIKLWCVPIYEENAKRRQKSFFSADLLEIRLMDLWGTTGLLFPQAFNMQKKTGPRVHLSGKFYSGALCQCRNGGFNTFLANLLFGNDRVFSKQFPPPV